MRRRDDSVFFFTIVDLLIVTIFLGLVLFVDAEAKASQRQAASNDTAKLVDSLTRLAGVSNLVELTDRLSRLGPVRELEKTMDVVAAVGGRDSVSSGIHRLRKLEGLDLPPCLLERSDGKPVVKPLAEITAFDSVLVFEGSTPALDSVLATIGMTFEDVRTLSVGDFRTTFETLLDRRPDCRFTIILNERTQLVGPRDAVGRSFYHRIRKVHR